MTTFTRPLLLAFVAFYVSLGASTLQASSTPLRFEEGAASVDELLSRFVEVLEANDPDGLQRLRVTEREYRELVVPGNVQKGEPAQMLSAEASEYFWQLMDQKSLHFQELLLLRHGGKSYAIKTAEFEKGHKEYAGHQAWRRLALVVTDEHGKDRLIRTGSIIERDDRFKFVSFIRD